jgi:Zn-dependent protease with chaperone function
MRPALLVFGYAVAVAWSAPVLLARLTGRGIRPQLGLAAWLTAMISVLASAVVAVQFLIRAAVISSSQLAEAVCRSVTGAACTSAVYRSAVLDLALGAAAIGTALTAVLLGWRYGRSVRQAWRRTRAHADAARIVGSRLPGAARPGRGPGAGAAVVLDAPEPVAYCVPGRPGTIVVTSGALAVLDPAQLSAVLAHERAHLAGRHHLLITLTRALEASFPAVPLFTRGPREVARLAEMCADDAAARHSGRRTLVAALLAMRADPAGPPAARPAPAGPTAAGPTAARAAAALAATGCGVTDRVQRLLDPPGHARHLRYGLALVTVTVALVLASGLITTFAGPLAAHGLAAA